MFAVASVIGGETQRLQRSPRVRAREEMGDAARREAGVWFVFLCAHNHIGT